KIDGTAAAILVSLYIDDIDHLILNAPKILPTTFEPNISEGRRKFFFNNVKKFFFGIHQQQFKLILPFTPKSSGIALAA
ncbi:MAG: hypothetical protein QNI92_10205, partial [Desulfobacterales bacterium]|nr:hypothetical protein [Desulfobacterales bacterium]